MLVTHMTHTMNKNNYILALCGENKADNGGTYDVATRKRNREWSWSMRRRGRWQEEEDKRTLPGQVKKRARHPQNIKLSQLFYPWIPLL